MELMKDPRSYLEGQGNKHRRIKMNWTEVAARHRRREEIPVCGTRLPDGTRTPSLQSNRLHAVDGRERRHRPRKTRQSTFCDDLHARGVRWSEVDELVADRVHWRNLLPIVLRRDWKN